MATTGYLHIRIADESKYLITGDCDVVLDNPRAMIALNRIGYTYDDSTITVTFTSKERITTFDSIRRLTEKFEIQLEVDESISAALNTYTAELSNFKTFSKKATYIRNNRFEEMPELTRDFSVFKDILSSTMIRKLYDLQMLSAFHMAFSQNACNFAVPGAGKTSIVYGAYAYLKSLSSNDSRHVDKILVIGPLSSFAPWEKEYKKCFGVEADSQRLSGDASISIEDKEHHLYSDKPKELTLISHASMHSLKPQILDFLKQNKVLVVVDEAHRIKNADGLWGKSAIDISKEATARVVLTGTPAPNGYEDLYNLIQFIYPFKYKEILGIHYGQLRELTKSEAPLTDERVATFLENIKPYFIRIKKQDLRLPPTTDETTRVPMDPLQRKIYNFIEDRYVSHFQNKPSATAKDTLNRARLIRLRQAATNPKMLIKPLLNALESAGENSDPNIRFAQDFDEGINNSEIFKDIQLYQATKIPAKFIEIERIYRRDIMQSGGKVIIWTIFVQNAEELQEYLRRQGIEARLLIGRIPQDEREEIVDKFNDPDNDDFSVVIANPFSVAESISLHEGCHNAIYMERDYNAANFIQSKDRIHRVGLGPDVVTRYYYLITPDSVDEVLNKSINAKVERMEGAINEDIPLFSRVHDDDETDIITNLLHDYARRI